MYANRVLVLAQKNGMKKKTIPQKKLGMLYRQMESPRILRRTSAKGLRFMLQTLNRSNPQINPVIQ
jgi:hypothetical protein